MEKLFFHVKEFELNQWNTEKIRGKHQVEPYECEEIFFNELLYLRDALHSKDEQRYQAFGITNSGRMLFVAFTVRGERIRVISARDMHRKERRIFYEEIKKDT